MSFFEEFILEIIIALIISAIIGAGTSFWILIKCVHKQAEDLNLMKKATILVFRMIAKDTVKLHGDEHNLADIDKIYKELINSD